MKSAWRVGRFGIVGALLAISFASAQTYEGRPVTGVEVEGTRTLSEGTLRFYLG